MKKIKVFLGGTCNGSLWRNQLIPMLKENIDAFNPVVENWTPECQVKEVEERESSDFVIYTITPKMTGVFAIAEVVEDSNKRPSKTIFCVLNEDEDVKFESHQIKSLDAVKKLVKNNGAVVFNTLADVADALNFHTQIVNSTAKSVNKIES